MSFCILSSRGEIKAKISSEKITLDKRNFPSCYGKEVEEWSWKRMKHERWIVHVDEGGNINKEKVSSL